ncbi:MAG: ABC transporter permease [Sphaerochaetaceae bacterium]|jgi:ribose transport system permease protein|nr:ABC transporter permease [Sphaerochaetaceae bacterium]HHU88163.1 ABC transporter permease [Spirochaetales bacterium]
MESKENSARKKKIVSFLREWGLIFAIVIITLVATIIRPAFLSGKNMLNILRAYSTIGIASIGMAYAVIGGGMDLSVGSTISLTAVITMLIINNATVATVAPASAALLALLVGILLGALVGAVNGAILAVVNGRMAESFIITYAMQIVVGAIAQAIVKGNFQAAQYRSGLFKQFGMGFTPVLFMIVVAVVMQFILVKTKFGRSLYFLGSSMKAAKMAGLKVKQVRFLAHLICGMCAGLAGVIVVSRVGSASVLQGQNYELDALVCVAIGGTSLDGGSGSILRTVLGVMVIGFMMTALNILGVQSNAQLIVRGTVIVLAVALDVLNKSMKLREVAQ